MEYGSVKDIAVGLGIKYVQGFGYFGTSRYAGTIENKIYRSNPVSPDSMALLASFDFLQQQANIPFDSVGDNIMKPAGHGMGWDIGVTAQVYEGIRAGFSITDIGSVTWDKNTKAIIGNGSVRLNSLDKGAQDSLKNAFKGSTVDTTSFTTSLPTALHLGASWQAEKFFPKIPGTLTVAADLHVGFNDEPGNTKKAQVGIGVEWAPWAFLPLRTGFLFGGRESIAWSLGMGFHIGNVMDIDFATGSIAILTSPNSFRNGSFAFGIRWRV
jgi:hypothetical protein